MKKKEKKFFNCIFFAVAVPNIALSNNNKCYPDNRKQVGVELNFKNAFLKNTLRMLLLIILGSGSEINAQEFHKWEVGTDLLWLINKNTLPNYSILVRRKLTPTNSLRVRLGGNLLETVGVRTRTVDTRSFIIRAGYERSLPLGENEDMEFMVGGDLSYETERQNIPLSFVNNSNSQIYYITRSKYKEMGGVLFAGFRYYINSNLSTSFEANLKFSKVRETVISTGIPFNENVNSNKIAFIPLSVLNISYHF